jgi:hypothetical protein
VAEFESGPVAWKNGKDADDVDKRNCQRYDALHRHHYVAVTPLEGGGVTVSLTLRGRLFAQNLCSVRGIDIATLSDQRRIALVVYDDPDWVATGG